MTSRQVLAAALVGFSLTGAPPRSQQAGELELATVRFYRPAAGGVGGGGGGGGGGGQTLVDVFCRVPFALLDRIGPDPSARAVYRVTVTVRDSAGLELLSQSWTDAAPGSVVDVPGASGMQHFTFALKPGRYTVDVAVRDSATGRVSRRSGALDAYPAAPPPRSSDLLLATGIRRAVDPADTVLRAGEVRKGSLFLTASGRPVLTPRAADLGYYLELYPTRAETVAVVLRVKAPDGRQLVETQPQRVPIGADGGVTRGMVPLAGLPPGSYQLEVAALVGDSQVVRSADFRMAGFETEATLSSVARARRTEGFEGMTEGALDSLYGPLLYIMTSEEQGIYPTLSVEGKRNFLRQFWAKRDPTPGTQGNEEQDRFYGAIREANRRFREGGSAEVPGWRTDRGRIFIKYGAPDETLERPLPQGTMPFEVWKYTRGRARKFVFMDLTGFGNYSLIYTDERREPSRPNWEELLGREAVQEVQRF